MLPRIKRQLVIRRMISLIEVPLAFHFTLKPYRIALYFETDASEKVNYVSAENHSFLAHCRQSDNVLIIEIIEDVEQPERAGFQNIIDLFAYVVHIIEVAVNVRPCGVAAGVVVRWGCNRAVKRIPVKFTQRLKAVSLKNTDARQATVVFIYQWFLQRLTIYEKATKQTRLLETSVDASRFSRGRQTLIEDMATEYIRPKYLES